jgi:cellulose synthase/poly-beta-1,6-N-acetylglucosamine synthase-like glycosyltransferase
MRAGNLNSPPFVSLIVPVRNEATHIGTCLEALLDQTYPADRVEILVVDGMSDDATVSVVRDAMARDSRVRLLMNPELLMAAGLNQGISMARGDVIGVISGHSIVEPDYLTRSVANLLRTEAWSTGGAIVRIGATPVQRAIAAASSSSIGVGDARHNYATQAGWVESVFPGLWPRRVFDEVGPFDVTMPYNEDNELSLRIRNAGGGIWYDPDVRVRYVPRESLPGLFTQYRRYARGRIRVYRKHGAGIGWRHLLPPALVLWIALGWIGGLVSETWLLPWVSSIVVYAVALVLGSIPVASGANVLLVAVAAGTMHLGYGVGMLQGALDLLGGRIPR